MGLGRDRGDTAAKLRTKSPSSALSESASSYQNLSTLGALRRSPAGDADASHKAAPVAPAAERAPHDGVPLSPQQPGQRTEDSIGPYELQDFHLYYMLRYGFKPSKVAFLAHTAWGDATRGAWPDDLPEHHQYTLGEVRKHLGTFLWRFFKTSQFKRSCVPNGPKVGSGGSLSPRGDWRAPSDSEAAVWMAEWETIPDEPNSL